MKTKKILQKLAIQSIADRGVRMDSLPYNLDEKAKELNIKTKKLAKILKPLYVKAVKKAFAAKNFTEEALTSGHHHGGGH